MKKSLMFLVLLGLAAPVLAWTGYYYAVPYANLDPNGNDPNYLWTVATHWPGGALPGSQSDLRIGSDAAVGEVSPLVIADGITAGANQILLGYGGGYDAANNQVMVWVKGGKMQANWQNTTAVGFMSVGHRMNSKLEVSGGIMKSGDSWGDGLPVGYDGTGVTAVVNVRGGTVVCGRNDIVGPNVPSGPLSINLYNRAGTTGRVTVYGGTIMASDVYIGTAGILDIKRGSGKVMTVGDDRDALTTLATQGYILANGVADPRPLRMVYDGTYTTMDYDVNFVPYYAWDPDPMNGSIDIPVSRTLTWTPGDFALTHDVYFGTSFADVNTANHSTPAGVFKGNTGSASYLATGLQLQTTYYWRIDEIRSGPATAKGYVWSFTTTNGVTVDTFDTYTNNTQLTAKWHATNADAYNLALSTIDAGDSNQSLPNAMKFSYQNNEDVGGDSSVYATTSGLGITANWSVCSTIDIYYRGLTTNNVTAGMNMYCKLYTNSSSATVTFPGNKATLNDGAWHVWHIKLSSFTPAVTLTNVTKIQLGLTGIPYMLDPTGTMYFDTIKLYLPRCLPEVVPSDLTANDCLTNYADLYIMCRDWLQKDASYTPTNPGTTNLLAFYDMNQTGGRPGDAITDLSGKGNDATVATVRKVDANDANIWNSLPDVNDAFVSSYATGYGNAFNSDGRYVIKVPSVVPSDLNTVCTVSLRTQMGASITPNWQQLFQFATTDLASSGLFDFATVNSTRLTWNGVNSNIFTTAIFRSWNTWTWVKDQPHGMQYLYQNGLLIAKASNTGLMRNPQSLIVGGQGYKAYGNQWRGLIDDVRIYNRALTDAEVAYIAGLRSTQYRAILRGTVTQSALVYTNADISSTEANGSKIINFKDFAVLAQNWLQLIKW